MCTRLHHGRRVLGADRHSEIGVPRVRNARNAPNTLCTLPVSSSTPPPTSGRFAFHARPWCRAAWLGECSVGICEIPLGNSANCRENQWLFSPVLVATTSLLPPRPRLRPPPRATGSHTFPRLCDSHSATHEDSLRELNERTPRILLHVCITPRVTSRGEEATLLRSLSTRH